MSEKTIGDIVRANYNSGIYIGEIVEDRGDKFLVKVLAVEKHPMQGDLHHPKQVEGVFFHERKALAFNEKMNVAKGVVFPFEGEVPNYSHSLKEAVTTQKEKLMSKETEFNMKALEVLNSIEKNYYIKSYY
ncbi:kinase-associated lipoprotein B [Ornithinibacillus halophilus]|uniref:Kinase-associated protein B n=1 Tax=Ornithinibacillus halophilus TaxID=930117 RepID=A0A1M5NDJ7_9BACI|nr:kinase-associated lipoprotein B [Ornithinibacillus halophilus]SHG87269.1 kinase-associated protein B [Ornithinibacillus halophilus]